MGGRKYDQGKPDFSYTSYEFLEEMARVREFGAKKYTRYGECTCAVSVRQNQSTPKQCVGVATTKTLSNEIQSTHKDSATTIGSGSEKTVSTSRTTIQARPATQLQNDTKYQERLLTNSSMEDVSYAERPSDLWLTTTTKQDGFVGAFASHATSGLGGLRSPDGSSEHLPTCAALRVISPGRNNWKKGFLITRSCAAALRHIYKFLCGETNDPESGLCHLSHAACCLEHALFDLRYHPENDDRDKPGVTDVVGAAPPAEDIMVGDKLVYQGGYPHLTEYSVDRVYPVVKIAPNYIIMVNDRGEDHAIMRYEIPAYFKLWKREGA